MTSRWFVSLFAVGWLGAALAAPPLPTALTARVKPLARVESVQLPALDLAAIRIEDAADESLGKPPRFAIPRKLHVTPDRDGTWESVDADTRLWRYVVKTPDALSLNLGFTRFHLPPRARLLIHSPDGKRVHGPVTAKNNAPSRQYWTPVVTASEIVVELTVPAAEVPLLELEIGQVGQGYRGFGSEKGGKGGLPPDSSGSCNMDVKCLLAADPWQDNVRAVAAYTLNGSRHCTGSLVNNTAQDTKLYFMTANHCLDSQAEADTVVTYWNYDNTTCRVPGSAASGQPGDGPLDQTISGATLRATYATSDFTLLELDGEVPQAFGQFWAGWDRTPYTDPGGPDSGDTACSPDSLCAAIHHPSVADKRITFAEENTVSSGYGGNAIPPVPGNRTHTWVHWDPTPVFPPDPTLTIPPQVTEGGSSGSPLYNAQRRFIGQLHGGPSGCGATGDELSDVYGRISISWEGGGTPASRLKDWLDPAGIGALTMDGRNACTAPPVPGNVVATASAANQITVSWDAAAGADSYKVYRGDGACPGTNWQLVASNVTATGYVDAGVSGGATYAYAVTSFGSAQSCESAHSECNAATATGACTLAPTFGGLTGAASSAEKTCGVDLAWSEGTNRCGSGTLKYSLFRSTTPGFTPDAGNRIASCVAGTGYHDATVASGTRYYYVARAEDDSGNGAGACNGGNEDTNMVELAAIPGGPPAISFGDDVESGTSNWGASGSGAGANFAQVTDRSHSPTHSWFAPDGDDVGDHSLATAAPIAVGPGATLEFWHFFQTESTYDGVVLEYSLDGSAWSDILAANGDVAANPDRITSAGYGSTISTAYENPIGGRRAWSGDSGGFVRVVVDMADFGGRSVQLRWRLATDNSNGAAGYWLDDVLISAGTRCSFDDTVFEDGFDGLPN